MSMTRMTGLGWFRLSVGARGSGWDVEVETKHFRQKSLVDRTIMTIYNMNMNTMNTVFIND